MGAMGDKIVCIKMKYQALRKSFEKMNSKPEKKMHFNNTRPAVQLTLNRQTGLGMVGGRNRCNMHISAILHTNAIRQTNAIFNVICRAIWSTYCPVPTHPVEYVRAILHISALCNVICGASAMFHLPHMCHVLPVWYAPSWKLKP